jgi:hypothetical protein
VRPIPVPSAPGWSELTAASGRGERYYGPFRKSR